MVVPGKDFTLTSIKKKTCLLFQGYTFNSDKGLYFTEPDSIAVAFLTCLRLYFVYISLRERISELPRGLCKIARISYFPLPILSSSHVTDGVITRIHTRTHSFSHTVTHSLTHSLSGCIVHINPWPECAVGGVRQPQHTQTSSNSSTIAADRNNGVTRTRCCRYSCLRS